MTSEPIREIPPGVYRYRTYAEFVHGPWSGDDARWYLFGPASLVMSDQVIDVRRFSDGGISTVAVLEIVGERMVRTKTNGLVRYVLATFDNVVDPAPAPASLPADAPPDTRIRAR